MCLWMERLKPNTWGWQVFSLAKFYTLYVDLNLVVDIFTKIFVSLLTPHLHSLTYSFLSSTTEEASLGQKMSSEEVNNKQEQLFYELVSRFFEAILAYENNDLIVLK